MRLAPFPEVGGCFTHITTGIDGESRENDDGEWGEYQSITIIARNHTKNALEFQGVLWSWSKGDYLTD
jgi:hypothetical protein